MIEVESGGMCIESAIATSSRDLVFVKPAANVGGALVGLSIYSFSIPWLLKPLASPFCTLFRCWLFTNPRAILTCWRAVFCRRAFSLKSLVTDSADSFSWLSVFPGWHISIIPQMFQYPCKPDIFEATYEPVEENA